MTAYGETPMSEENGTSLGLAYVQVQTDVNGVVQTATRGYWNRATKVFDVGPRDDAKHVKPYQRLSDDAKDKDNLVQLAAVEREALAWTNVVAVVYTIDAAGAVTGIYRTYPHNIVQSLASVNNTNF
jgi:hypothetical protein